MDQVRGTVIGTAGALAPSALERGVMRASRLRSLVLALSITATGCAHTHPTSWGLPDAAPHASLEDTRHATRERVQAIANALATRRNGGDLEGEALTVLTDAYLALGNDTDHVPTEFDDG